MGFIVRNWSSTNPRPFDVVYQDRDNNNVHYQPDVEFSHREGAEMHKAFLERNFTGSSLQFIRDHWPVDGGIE